MDESQETDFLDEDLAAEKLKQDKKKKKKSTATKEESVRQQHTRAANFTPIDKLKEKATAAAMKKQYSVFDYYKDQTYRPGIASARETWVTPVVLLMAGGSSGLPEGTVLLRLIRLVRLVRLTRLTRLLRSFPELMIIVKGLAFAARSVCVFSLLWAIITYAFAIILRQLTEGSAIGTTFFSSVPDAWAVGVHQHPAATGSVWSQCRCHQQHHRWKSWTVAHHGLLHGLGLGDDHVPWKSRPDDLTLRDRSFIECWVMSPQDVAQTRLLKPCSDAFGVLKTCGRVRSPGSRYMLLGVLVDVIGAVASTEKQKIEITYIVGQLREELEKLAIEAMELNQADFQKLVLEPGIVRVMHEAGVNVDTRRERP
eukprot:g251.t1